MSEHASHSAEPKAESFMDRQYFLLRRLHSLSGIVPVGLFVMVHLFTNFQLFAERIGFGSFQHEVNFIHATPALLFIEIALWSSIAFHALLGIYYTTSGKVLHGKYRYGGYYRYILQRVTGYMALLFIFVHVATLRWGWDFGLSALDVTFYVAGPDGHPMATPSVARALQNPIISTLYVIFSLAIVFHWANGLWTAAISWGLTVTVQAQRRWGYVCAAIGLGLSVFTFGAVIGARTYTLTPKDKATFEAIEVHGQKPLHESDPKMTNELEIIDPMDDAPSRDAEAAVELDESTLQGVSMKAPAAESTKIGTH